MPHLMVEPVLATAPCKGGSTKAVCPQRLCTGENVYETGRKLGVGWTFRLPHLSPGGAQGRTPLGTPWLAARTARCFPLKALTHFFSFLVIEFNNL